MASQNNRDITKEKQKLDIGQLLIPRKRVEYYKYKKREDMITAIWKTIKLFMFILIVIFITLLLYISIHLGFNLSTISHEVMLFCLSFVLGTGMFYTLDS